MRNYIKIFFLFLVVFSSANFVLADGSRALRLLEKRDYEKLIDHLNKSLDKDSLNPGAKYVYSLLYLDSGFFRFDVDTSYMYINSALEGLPFLEEKEILKLAKDDITDSAMLRQKHKVEMAGYLRARQLHSLEAYNRFIHYFDGAARTDSAIYHRNAIAYQKAEEKNTYQAFQDFIHTYPNAIQLNEARVNYDKLLFRSKTDDGKLETYVQFLNNNPGTPHRNEAERNIFELATADNEVSSYLWFLENYPSSTWRQKAFDFLYHRYKEISGVQGFLNRFSNFIFSDSLKYIARTELKTIFPVYEDGKYGFVDGKGDFVIPLQYDSIKEQLLCGDIRRDFLEVSNNNRQFIVSRLGHIIFEGKYEEVEDIGSGLLKVKIKGKYGLVHKSGPVLLDFDFEDVALLNHKFVKIKIKDKWGLISILGRKLLDVSYDEIEAENNFILIKSGDYYAVQNVSSLKNVAQGDRVELFFSFEDYLLPDNNHLLVFAGENETLIDNHLKTVSKTENQEIHRFFDGWLSKTSNGYIIYDLIYKPLSGKTFSDVQKSNLKLALKSEGKWGIYHQGSAFPESFDFESVIFLGEKISLVNQGDKTYASFSRDTVVDITGNQEVKLLKPQIASSEGKDIPEYLLVKNKKGIYTVYNTNGVEVLDGRFDEVEALGYEYLLVTRNGKKGLYHNSGKELLKTSYQGIGNYNNGYVSTFLNNKFGIYNYHKNELLLSAKHDRMLRIYNDHFFISEKGGNHAFVNLNNDLVSGYDFQTIELWNDTVALVKAGEHWALYDIKNKNYVFEKIELIERLKNPSEDRSKRPELFLFITKNNQEGVLSNISGVVVGPTFNDVYNIGTAEEPIFFAEKYIPEAEFYIIIYYSKTGEIIKKQVFTDDEYWKVYCGG